MSKHHHHAAPQDSYELPATWEKGRNILLGVVVLGWVAALAGYSIDHKQFFPSYLVAFFFGTGIAIGAALFTMIQHLTWCGLERSAPPLDGKHNDVDARRLRCCSCRWLSAYMNCMSGRIRESWKRMLCSRRKRPISIRQPSISVPPSTF
jgi:hypothetical protein